MRVTIVRRFEMSCAHQLHGLRDGHKCARVHGHNYGIEVEVELLPGAALDSGMVVDAEFVDSVVGPIVRELDHTNLNEAEDCYVSSHPYFEMRNQPTAENIALALMSRCSILSNGAQSGRIRLVSVTVHENGRLSAKASL